MSGSGRRILAGLFWLLASLAIMVGSVTLWAHQSLLTSDGWVRLTSQVMDDPEVVAGTSEIVVDRISQAIDLDSRVAGFMPAAMAPLSGVLTTRVEEAVADRLADVVGREDVQDALGKVNRAAHDAAIVAIKGGDEAVTSEGGVISLNLLPIVEGALVSLQEAGFIDADRQIPDLSEYAPPEQAVAKLESVLGRQLPDDIGTIQLVDSDRLATVQQAVRSFDLITIGVLAVAAACVAIALWLSRRRLRMAMWIALGAVAALALGRVFTRMIVEAIGGSLADGPSGTTVRAVIDASVDQIMWFTFVVIAMALIVAGVALWLERRSAGAAATAKGSAETPAGAAEGAPPSVSEWLRGHDREITITGLAVIGFLVLWRVAGPDIALLAEAGAGAWLIAVNVLAGRPEEEEPGRTEAENPAPSGGG